LNFEVLCKRDVKSRDRDFGVTVSRRDWDVRKNASRPSRDQDVRDRDYNHAPQTYAIATSPRPRRDVQNNVSRRSVETFKPWLT